MSVPFKPEGCTTGPPYLLLEGASRTIEFLITAFDGVELRRVTHDDGRLGDSVVMLADGYLDWPTTVEQVHI
jgi:PhnB protein